MVRTVLAGGGGTRTQMATGGSDSYTEAAHAAQAIYVAGELPPDVRCTNHFNLPATLFLRCAPFQPPRVKHGPTRVYVYVRMDVHGRPGGGLTRGGVPVPRRHPPHAHSQLKMRAMEKGQGPDSQWIRTLERAVKSFQQVRAPSHRSRSSRATLRRNPALLEALLA